MLSSIRTVYLTNLLKLFKDNYCGGIYFSLCYNNSMRLIFLIFVLISLKAQSQDLGYSEEVIANYENGILAYQSNDSKTAATLFNQCISADSSCFEAHYNLALIHFEQAKFKQAMASAFNAEKLRPFDARLASLIGRTHYQQSNYPKAEIYLKRALSIGDSNADNLLYLALSLQKQDNFKYALHYFNELLSLYPPKMDYYFNRGLLYTEMEEFENAMNDFEAALGNGIDALPNIYYHLANTSLKLGEGEQALAYMDEGLNIVDKKEKIALLLLKGTFYRDIGAYETAATHYTAAYELENENPLVLTHQAAVMIDLEKYETAIDKCNAAIALNPNQMEAYFNRGIAHEMIRDVDQACSDWQKAFVLGSQKAIQYLNGPVCNE